MNKPIKKIMSVIAIVVLAAVVIYEAFFGEVKPTPTSETVDCYKLETVLSNDFELAKTFLVEGENLVFYEAETVLDSAATNDVVKIVDVMTIFQMKDRCLFIKHAEGAYTNAPQTSIADPGHWCGNWEIPMEPCAVTFDRAVELLHQWNGVIPTGDKMTLRRPQGVIDGKDCENALYIFGTMGSGFVAVDSKTGAIIELADGKQSLETSNLQE